MDQKQFVPTMKKSYLYSLKHLYDFIAVEAYFQLKMMQMSVHR